MWLRGLTIAILFILSPIPTSLESVDNAHFDGWAGGDVASPASGVPPSMPRTVGFIQNAGQLDAEGVRLYLTYPGGAISFLDSEVRMTVYETSGTGPDVCPDPGPYPSPERVPGMVHRRGDCVGISFVGSNVVTPVGRDPMEGRFNYFIGNDSSRWSRNVPRYREVVFEDLYDGIDLVYRSVDGRVKYEFIVAPFADPDAIRVRVRGSDGVEVDPRGDLVIRTSVGEIADTELLSFIQDEPSKEVESSFLLLGGGVYGFKVAEYLPTDTLIIDPEIYSSYFGGDSFELSYGIAYDEALNIYITGETESTDFPITPGSFNATMSTNWNAFVSKFNPRDWSLVYSTYLGGSVASEGYDIAVDARGQAHVIGYSYSDDFPTTAGVFSVPGQQVFLAKLAHNGSDLVYSTVLGGNGYDVGAKLTLDGDGRAIIGGYSSSDDFPIVNGSYIGTDDWDSMNIFVTKFNEHGTALVFSSMFGGDEYQYLTDIVPGPSGRLYVTGYTQSSNFPTTEGAYQTELIDGRADGFVGIFDSNFSQLEAMTLFGGGEYDTLTGLVLGSDGRIIVTGSTSSIDLPTAGGALYEYHQGGYDDGFLVVLSDDLAEVLYCSYVGGRSADYITNVGISAGGDVFLTGYSLSPDLPITPDGFPPPDSEGYYDGFLMRLDPRMVSLEYCTYFGGTETDRIYDMAVMEEETVLLAGYTASNDTFVSNDSYQDTFAGELDCMIIVLDLDTVPPIASAGDDIVCSPFEITRFDGSGSMDNLEVANWTWTFEDHKAIVTQYGEVVNFTFKDPGVHNVTLTVRDLMDHSASDNISVVVVGTFPDAVIPLGEGTSLGDPMFTDSPEDVRWTWDVINVTKVMEVLTGPNPSYTPPEPGLYLIGLNVTDTTGHSVDREMYLSVMPASGSFANAGKDVTIDQHGTVDFCDECSVGMVFREWTFDYMGEEVVVTVRESSFTFHQAGTYVVSLHKTDIRGQDWRDAMTVIVRDTTPPTIVLGPDMVVDQHDVVYFNTSGSYDNVGIVNSSFVFMYRGERVILEGPTAFFVFDDAGFYAVYLFIIDAAGLDADAAFNVTVRDITTPVARIARVKTIPQYETFFFDGTNSSDNVEIVNYTWSFSYRNEMVELYGPFPNFKFEDVGRIEVLLTVFDAARLLDKATMMLNVVDTTSPMAHAGEDVKVRVGQRVFFDGLYSTDNNDVESWTWNLTDAGTDVVLNGPLPEYVFKRPGTYVVTLTVRDEAGNQDLDTMVVTVRSTGEDDDGIASPVVWVTVAVVSALAFVAVLLLWRRRGGTDGPVPR